jgi:predicted flap endonuclease-1-like 5' DNA nuclease
MGGDAVKIIEVEGIGPVYAAKLDESGVGTTEALLEKGATPKGRAEIAAATGIDVGKVLTWVNHVDLMRLTGVGSEYADLLEAAGVDSPAELAHRNGANLTTTMAEANAARPMVRQLPSESQVERWIDEAKALPKIVQH